jgi:CelD/BcsL family acetyltransferase involved in cellulose biosynthesis
MAQLEARLVAPEDRDEASVAWRQAERSVPDPPLACTWAWTEVWLRHYGDLADHRFVVGERDGQPVAAALLTRGAPGAGGRLGVRHLHIGTAGEPRGESVCVEHNGLLAREADRPAFARALLEVARSQRGWDELVLDGFDVAHAADLGAAEPRLVMRRAACAFTDLARVGRDGVEVADLLAPHARRRVRQTLRAFGALEQEWACSAGPAGEILNELVELHQRRWRHAGHPGAFVSPRFAAFHRELVRRLAADGRAVLFRVRRDGETIGCLYGFVDRGRLLFYQGGLQRFDDNRLRSGLAAHVLLMGACAARGLREYDFLAGEARYKSELATGARELVWARWMRRPVRSGPATALRRVREGLSDRRGPVR